MEWINKKEKMPPKHPEFDGCSDDVMVTDGKDWGYGRYYWEYGYWVYELTAHYGTNNKITHWALPPELP